MDLSAAVYRFAPSWVMALLCVLVAVANIYQSYQPQYRLKRWPKRLKAANWALVSSVYLYSHILEPVPGEAKVLFRVAIGLLVLGELAYHFDTLLNIAEVIAHKAGRRVRKRGTIDS